MGSTLNASRPNGSAHCKALKSSVEWVPWAGRGRLSLATLTTFLLLGCGGGGGGDDEESDVPVTTSTVTVALDVEQVTTGVAAPFSATGSGSFSVRSGEDTNVSGSVTFSGFQATSVSIHEGFAGEPGPVVAELTSSGGAIWSLPQTELDPDEVQRLELAGFYVLASGVDGRIRGQVLPEGWIVEILQLSGDQRVPPVDTSARGRAGLVINPTTGAYRLRVTADGVGEVTAVAVYEGWAGERGTILFDLEASDSQANRWGSIDINDQSIFPRLNLLALDLFRTGGLYVKISTTQIPDGELRGQITPSELRVQVTELTAGEVVLENGDLLASDDRAIAITTFNTVTNEIAINVHSDAENICCVELREGAFGENGPFVAALTLNARSPDTWSLPLQTLADDRQAALLEQRLHLIATGFDAPDGLARGQLIVGGTAAQTETTIGKNGGQLALVDPAGATFTLTMLRDSVVTPTQVTMARAEDVPGLSSDFRVLAAVSLGPDGTDFGAAPVLVIDGINVPAQNNVRFGYIVSDDGARSFFTPFRGEDPLAAARETRSHELNVPHFSVVAVVEPRTENTPIPPPTSPIPESIARAELTQLVNESVAANGSIDKARAEMILAGWGQSIEQRAANLDSTNFEAFNALIEEYSRWRESASSFESETLRLDKVEQDFFVTTSIALAGFDQQCNDDAFDAMLDWLAPLERLYGGIVSDDVTRVQLDCLISISIAPAGPLAGIKGEPDIVVTATATSPDGRDVSEIGRLGLGWKSVIGLNTLNGPTIALDASEVGLRRGEVVFPYFSIGGDRDVAAVILPEFRGTRRIEVIGSASGCSDPEDDGPGAGGGTVSVDTEIVESLSDTAAGMRLIGTGSVLGATITAFEIEATYSNNTVGTVRGTSGGNASFSITEIDEDTGEIITTTGDVNFFGGTASGTSLDFPNASGSDSSGCTLTGSVKFF